MSRLIPSAERILKARALIEKARQYPVPPDGGRGDFSYIAHVKDLLQQARDMIKFINYNPATSAEMKAEVLQINQETVQAEKEILHGGL
jgi:hypothetical protein